MPTHPQNPRAAGEEAHTPTPWKIYGLYRQSDGHNGVMIGAGGMVVCEVLSGTLCPPEERDANAAFIVTACNSHAADKARIAELVSALESTLRVAEHYASDRIYGDLLRHNRAVLAADKALTPLPQ